ncbi:MAG TPA: CrcB family protein [Chloroflexota bacterium]|nr:CrcB family protein [Chloroflexota bacterium]
MPRVLIVFLGGGSGACLRALLLAGLASWGTTSPVLLANLIGSFLLGVVYVLADEAGLLRARTRLFLALGVLGGFTTFSTFGWGADLLVAHGHAVAALQYVAASVGGGLAAVIAGLIAGRELVHVLERGARTVLVRLEEGGSRRPRRRKTAMDRIETEDREASA